MAKQVKTPVEARVLVVEDEPNNRLVIVKLLQLAGFLPDNIFALAGDPVAYVRTQLAGALDLILLDLQLPLKDGYAILEELRADETLAHIPVVAVTANVIQRDVERARDAGFDGFIGKPINGVYFSEWMRRILAGEIVWSAV
jgi:two-component system, cell cycle response regulator DivK